MNILLHIYFHIDQNVIDFVATNLSKIWAFFLTFSESIVNDVLNPITAARRVLKLSTYLVRISARILMFFLFSSSFAHEFRVCFLFFSYLLKNNYQGSSPMNMEAMGCLSGGKKVCHLRSVASNTEKLCLSNEVVPLFVGRQLFGWQCSFFGCWKKLPL